MRESKLLSRVAQYYPASANTISKYPHKVFVEKLPFYKKHRLIRVVVALPQVPLLYVFLDGRDEIVVLPSGAAKIYLVNHFERLHLKKRHVLSYLRFFFSVAEKNPIEMIRTLQTLDEKKQGWKVSLWGFDGKDLLAKTVRVNRNGLVEIERSFVVQENFTPIK